MPKISVYKKELLEKKKKKAIELYKQGLTMREVGKLVGKSRTWVWEIFQELSTSNESDKD